MALIDKLNAIGDAIRSKTGKTNKITLDQMPTEISNIENAMLMGAGAEIYVIYGGQLWEFFDFAAVAFADYGITKEGSAIIVTNNPPQYKFYYPSLFPIAVSSNDGKMQIFLGNDILPEMGYVDVQTFTGIPDHGWIEKSILESLNFADETNIGFYTVKTVNYPLLDGTLTELKHNTQKLSFVLNNYIFLKNVDLPNIEVVPTGTFSGCSGLVSVNIPKAALINENAFENCSSLETINMQNAKTLDAFAFQGCDSLTTIDLLAPDHIGYYTFNGCSSLHTLIVRNQKKICTCAGYTTFFNTPIEKGEGYIYVPLALLDSYKAEMSWSDLANQFRAIEDYPEICG